MSRSRYLTTVLLFFLVLIIGFGVQATAWEWPQGIMRMSSEEVRAFGESHKRMPRASIIPKAFPISISLLPYLTYIPSERNQGACGNCWAWAGTGVSEIALNVQKKIKDRLSVQYISSCNTAKTCCQGGSLENFAVFYMGRKAFIPWSNINGNWQNGDGNCNVPCLSVGTTPNYSISGISPQGIATHGVGQAAAISNIKSILNQNKAIWFAFFLPTAADWAVFYSFWNNQNESVAFNYDFVDGKVWNDVEGGGHAILCVGYDETSWIMLNSWGTEPGRPNGLFRVTMNLNYDNADSDGYYNLFFQTLSIAFESDTKPLALPWLELLFSN